MDIHGFNFAVLDEGDSAPFGPGVTSQSFPRVRGPPEHTWGTFFISFFMILFWGEAGVIEKLLFDGVTSAK